MELLYLREDHHFGINSELISLHCINQRHDDCDRYRKIDIMPWTLKDGKFTYEDHIIAAQEINYRCECECHMNR